MEIVHTDFKKGFRVIAGNAESQSATMVMAPGDSTGSDTNRHPDSDQWLFVVSGEGEAIVEEVSLDLGTHSLVLIERGEAHEIKNTGTEPLETLNFYVPPEY